MTLLFFFTVMKLDCINYISRNNLNIQDTKDESKKQTKSSDFRIPVYLAQIPSKRLNYDFS